MTARGWMLGRRDALQLGGDHHPLTAEERSEASTKAWLSRSHKGEAFDESLHEAYRHSMHDKKGRMSNVRTRAERDDPEFEAALLVATKLAESQERDEDGHLVDAAPEWEQHNIVAVARGIRESHRPFEELHPGGSVGKYMKDGKYTPERLKEHDAIVQAYIDHFGPPQKHPEALVTGGLPGGGKTSGLNLLAPGHQEKYVAINSDDIKANLPEYREHGGVMAYWLHEESDDIAKRILIAAIHARQHVLIDTTMRSVGKDTPQLDDGTRGRLLALADEGYTIHGILTDVTRKEASRRAMQRYLDEGRYVPMDYIRGATADPKRYKGERHLSSTVDTFYDVIGYLDKWTHVSTMGLGPKDKPRIINESPKDWVRADQRTHK